MSDEGARYGSPPLARRGPLGHAQHAGPVRLTSARAERTSGISARRLWTSAHLRSRGEDSTTAIHRPRRCGSPPLARRGQRRGDRGEQVVRLTSARAERTAGPRFPMINTPAHLRSRGEDDAEGGERVVDAGSPPLARRGRHGIDCDRFRRRLTSARAERTCPRRQRPARSAAHLRSRGEDGPRLQEVAGVLGSPPLARRGPRLAPGARAQPRLTSARAERTTARSIEADALAAHLRSRGEDPFRSPVQHVGRGSPPLARRGPPSLPAVRRRPRLTSARAERTGSAARRGPAISAHLRSRGEDPSGPCSRLTACWLTSARAERTSSASAPSRRWSAHLRSRGEDVHRLDEVMRFNGSPPLARRGLIRRGAAGPRLGLTSARAERTS